MGFLFSRGFPLLVDPSVQYIPGQTRRVIRLVTFGRDQEFAKESLIGQAYGLKDEAARQALIIPVGLRVELADALLAIANGADAQKVFRLAAPIGGQEETDRHRLIAIDYWLRRRLYPKEKKQYVRVAMDWREAKERTIKDITRRWRRRVSPIVEKWATSADRDAFLEAVSVARHKVLTGEVLPIRRHPDETVFIVIDFSLLYDKEASAIAVGTSE